MNTAKLNEAIKDLENDIKIAHDNETIVDVLCGILTCQVGEITDSVRELVKLSPDGQIDKDHDDRMMRDAVLLAVQDSFDQDGHVMYDKEPRMQSDCYGDSVNIELEMNEEYLDQHLKAGRRNWESHLEDAQADYDHEQEKLKKAELLARHPETIKALATGTDEIHEAEEAEKQQSNCSGGE